MGFNRYISKQFADPKGFGGGLVSFIMNRQNRPLYDETIRLLSPTNKDSILDIGCGNGFVLNLMARQHKASFAGIDPSENIITAALRNNRKFVDSKKMRFLCENVEAMSFPDASFSKAYTINTVYFWSDLHKLMREIRRVLKPGGTFINTLYTAKTLSGFSHTQFGYRRYEPEQLIKAGTDAGFSVKVLPINQGAALCCVYQKND